MKRRLSLLLILAVLLTACAQPPATTPESAPEMVDTVQEALLQAEDGTSYQLTLTPEQVESYDNGHFLLLQHMGGDIYLPFYTSKNVTLEGQTLTANFNGKVPYLYNDEGQCLVPFTTEGETRDGKTAYKVSLVGTDCVTDEWGWQEEVTRYDNLHMVYDRATGALSNSLILPDDQEPEGLFEGQTAQHQAPILYAISGGTYYQIPKDADGRPLPTEEWITEGYSYIEWLGDQGVHSAYGRLAQVTEPYPLEDVYMLIVARDAQLQETLSELIPVSLTSAPAVKKPATEAVKAQWESGNKQLILQEQGLSVYLVKTSESGIISYGIQIKNDSQRDVWCEISEILLNGKIYVNDRSIAVTVKAGQWCDMVEPLAFPVAAAVGELDAVTQLCFTLEVQDGETFLPIYRQKVETELSGSSVLKAYYLPADLSSHARFSVTEPAGGFLLTQPQLLAEVSGVKISMLAVGKETGEDGLTCIFKAENTTDSWRYFRGTGIAVNGVCFDMLEEKELQPGASVYYLQQISGEDLAPIQQISQVALGACVKEGKLQSGYCLPDSQWYAVTGEQAAEAPNLLPEGTQLLEEQGLRISLLEQTTDYFGDVSWRLVVENQTDSTVYLTSLDERLDGEMPEYSKVKMSNSTVPAGQCAIMKVSAGGFEDVSFRLRAYNEQLSSLLFETEGAVQLKYQE